LAQGAQWSLRRTTNTSRISTSSTEHGTTHSLNPWWIQIQIQLVCETGFGQTKKDALFVVPEASLRAKKTLINNEAPVL
jgi:hypothetical protein